MRPPWAGTDGNSGSLALVIELASAHGEDVLGFYVARNGRFWYATPRAEIPGEDGLEVCEVNAIQHALNALRLRRMGEE